MPDAPIKFTYLLHLYVAMDAQAVDGVYEGKVTETFNSLGISQTYYTPLFKALKELGCIELLDRGARSRPTRYRMHRPPTTEEFASAYLTGGSKPAIVPLDEMEQRISNIERRLQGLELKEMFVDHEKRIVKLEQEGGSK